MVTTVYTHNDPNNPQYYEERIFKYAIQNTVLSAYMGTSDNSIIQVKMQLTKNKGDLINFQLRLPLSGAGLNDNQPRFKGNSEAMEYLNWSLQVHLAGHSVESEGPLSEQRTKLSFEKEAMDALQIWNTERLESDLIAAVCGLYNTPGCQTVQEAAPTSSRIHYGGETAAGVVSTATMTTDALLSAETAASTLFGLKTLEIVARKAKLASPTFRPVRIDGEEVRGLSIINSLQEKSMRASDLFNNSYKDGWMRGKTNPIFTNSDYFWNGILIKVCDRMPMRTGAGGTTTAEGFKLDTGKTYTTDPVANTKTVARGVFLGAQAACIAWAQQPKWHEGDGDIGKRLPIRGVDEIYGVGKTQWKDRDGNLQQDFATYAFDTQVQLDA